MSLPRWLAAAGLVLYLVALLLPAIDGPGFPALSGYDVLRQGAGAWRDDVFAWYANPLFFAGLAMCWIGRFRLALALTVAGLAVALTSLSAEALASRAGREVPAFAYAAGFYLWLLAFVALIASALCGRFRKHREASDI